MLERTGKASRLALGPAAIVALEIGDHDARRDGDDEHDDQDLDEREAAPVASPHHGSQDPMSASLPVPPGCPSAPKLNTSISPRSPGLRYWYC